MINKIKDNVFQLDFSLFGSCIYLLILKNKKILIDTSSSPNQQELIDDLQELNVNPKDIDVILITHQHWDHNQNINIFENAKVYDATNINNLNIKEIEVIKTPGHTTDSLCFLYQDILFSGDTIFHQGGRGRTDLPGGDESEIQESIKILKEVDYKILCPGHLT